MNYPGSKNGAGVFQTIINQIPPHDAFFEGFAGSGTIARMKRPAHVTVVIDVYSGSTNLLRESLPAGVVINDDVITTLRAAVDTSGYPEENCFVYLDPPYLKRDIDGTPVRSWQGDIYEHEFDTVEQHQTLLTLIKSLKCMVMISGYWSKLYANELKDWRTLSYNAMTRAGRPAKEWLWMNYPEPIALHDYSFLGENRTDRQRIKRKIKRWEERLANMPTLEKRVLLQAMEFLRHAP